MLDLVSIHFLSPLWNKSENKINLPISHSEEIPSWLKWDGLGVSIEYPPRHSTIHIRPSSSSFRQLIPPPPPAEKGTPPRDTRPPICYLFTCLSRIHSRGLIRRERDTGRRFSRTFQPLYHDGTLAPGMQLWTLSWEGKCNYTFTIGRTCNFVLGELTRFNRKWQ